MNEVARTKKVVEIGGVKMEVDMSTAKVINQYKVGDNVKILKNEGYGDNKEWNVYPGVIGGLVQFRNKPIIVIAYLKVSYSDVEVKFINLNEDTKDIEIMPALPEEIPISEASVIEKLNNEITEKEKAVTDAKAKKNYFVKHFNKYFKEEL